eukprot:4073209-Prymnesium_polylepis.1
MQRRPWTGPRHNRGTVCRSAKSTCSLRDTAHNAARDTRARNSRHPRGPHRCRHGRGSSFRSTCTAISATLSSSGASSHMTHQCHHATTLSTTSSGWKWLHLRRK